MGIRQSAQPMGLALAAATLPALAAGGTGVPLLFLAALFLAAATAAFVFVRDPALRPSTTGQTAPDRKSTSTSPYRAPSLWRIHAASALLVVPQFTITMFALVFLTDARGWTALDAGYLLAGAQLCGAVGRLGAGYWSDRTGSRLKPMRIIAASTGVGMLALAAAAAAGSSLAVPVLLFLGVVAVSSNGLSFTAVAEYAGSAWAGRALGIQTTGQNVLTAATPPVLALAIGAAGFAPSFAVVAAFPIIAAILVPVAAERTAIIAQAGQADPATAAAQGIRS
jgi:sugar phosphate permease